MPPTILFVPGIWEGPSVYEQVSSLLTIDGFKTSTAVLPSTGTISPGNPSMKDDIAAIRNHLKALISQGDDDVLLVLHSAGGFLGSEAMEGLQKKKKTKLQAGGEQHTEKHAAGGVIGIVFIAAAVFSEGYELQPLPFQVADGGALHCVQPEKLLFGDLPEDEKSKWLAKIQPQPSRGWDDTVTYAGWKDVPSVYLICEGDNILPTSLQEQMAGLANSKIERCSAGHIPQISQPARVVEVIKEAVSAFTADSS